MKEKKITEPYLRKGRIEPEDIFLQKMVVYYKMMIQMDLNITAPSHILGR